MTFGILLGAEDRRHRADSGLRLSINILLPLGEVHSTLARRPERTSSRLHAISPPPDSEAAWGRGAAIFQARRRLFLAINIYSVIEGAHSSLDRWPERISSFTGRAYLCFPFYFPVRLSHPSLLLRIREGEGWVYAGATG